MKHFWHVLLVEGLTVRPQLLIQGVNDSGTRALNSVSSFSVFRAIYFGTKCWRKKIGDWWRGMEEEGSFTLFGDE